MSATASREKLRLDIPGATYYLQLQGHGQRAIFQQRDDYQTFVDLLTRSAPEADVTVLGYCLLNRCVHLILRSSEQADLGSAYSFGRQLNQDYTVTYNQSYQRSGSVFRPQLICTLLNPTEYLAEGIAMLHRMPVLNKLVAEAHIYPWSSHTDYLHEGAKKDWLDCRPALELIGRQRSSQQRRYRDFIDSQSHGDSAGINWAQGCHSEYQVLASDHYVESLLQQLQPSQAKPPSIAVLTLAICREYGMAPQELLHARRHRYSFEVRALVAYLANKWGIANFQKSCQFLDCDPEATDNSLRSLLANREQHCLRLEQKMARTLAVDSGFSANKNNFQCRVVPSQTLIPKPEKEENFNEAAIAAC